jgi:soluble lytic murein transglycosylase-like protein
MFALILALVTSQVEAPTAETPAAYIQKLSPRVQPDRAKVLGKIIKLWADRYDLDPVLLAAIVRQESDYRAGLRSCWIVHRYDTCQVTCDYGLAQVNELWIKKWALDPQKLQFDDSYNIMIAARILRGLQREHGESDEDWYGRYHSGTPSKKSIYLEKLDALLAQR